MCQCVECVGRVKCLVVGRCVMSGWSVLSRAKCVEFVERVERECV